MTENIAGKVMTVHGPISPEDLGFTLMHEHLFIDLRRYHLPHGRDIAVPGRSQPISTTKDFAATELAQWGSPVSIGNLNLPNELAPVSDQWVLADEQLAIHETLEFKRRGGGTIVDVTNIGLKRDPAALKRVSSATGLHIVMGSGWYQKVFHPDDMDRRSEKDLTQEIISDLTSGVGDTGIQSGIIGEVGVNGNPITHNEEKSIRASARASVITGAAITFHEAGFEKEKHDVLNWVEDEGADLERVVVGHCNKSANNLPFLKELLERGVYVEFELIGQSEALGVSVQKQAAEAVVELIEDGYCDKVLLAQDVCIKTHLKHYGGGGYSYMQETFVPHLATLGVTGENIEMIFIQNPKTLLTFVQGFGSI